MSRDQHPTPEVEARKLLRLFPGWVRGDRGEEALALVLDQLPPGTTRLPLRSRLDLLRAGLHSRWRDTPPLGVWTTVAYADPRNQSGYIPERWHPWLVHWLRDPRWRRWFTLTTFATMALPLAALLPIVYAALGTGSFVFNVLVFPAAFSFAGRVRADRWVAIIALRNGLEPGTLRPLPPGATRQSHTPAMVPDRAVAPVARGAAGYGAALLLATVLVTLLWGETPSPNRLGLGVAGVLAAVECAVIVQMVVRPAVRRIGQAPEVAPLPPPPAEFVDVRFGWQVSRSRGWPLLVIPAIPVSLLLVAGAVVGIIVWSLFVVASSSVFVAIARRERAIGRPLGVWEAFPVLGPQTLVLIRDDVLEAEGLRVPTSSAASFPDPRSGPPQPA